MSREYVEVAGKTRTAAASLTADFRRSLVRNLVLLVLVTVGAITAVTIATAYRTVAELCRSVVSRTADQVNAELAGGFFQPMERGLLAARGWGATGLLDIGRPEDLSRLFAPILRANPRVSSMMVASEAGREYMLLRQTDGWLRRISDPVSGEAPEVWYLDEELQPVRRGTKELDYDARERRWFQGAMATSADGVVHWTEPYKFFTTNDPGITASVRWTAADGSRGVVAFDLLLRDITDFTSQLEVTKLADEAVLDDDQLKPLVAVISPGGKMIGFPRGFGLVAGGRLKNDEEWLKPARELEVLPLQDAIESWRREHDSSASVFRYESKGKEWWAGVRQHRLAGSAPDDDDVVEEGDDFIWSVVLVPEWVYLQEYARRRNMIVGIGFLALIAAIVLAMATDRAVRRRVSRAVREASRLGQYVIEEKLGDGGMGTVYRARHEMLRRPTAIKLLREDRATNEDALKRFEREVQITSRLTHPNTIAIYDYGRTPQGVFYYAMECLHGISLQDLVDIAGPLQPARVIFLLEQACGSLQEAHVAGLIHRDIKPANIMVCERGSLFDVVKVLDFGLVKEVGQDSDSRLTAANTITGTPLYISPEALTAADTVDARSDLYALGAVGYFALTGETVFDGETVMDVCAQHLTAQPVRPSERTGAAYPRDLEDVLLACLAKEPAERPQSAENLATRLAACHVAGRWGQPQARKWWERHETLVDDARKTDDGPASTRIETTASARPTIDIDFDLRE